MISFVNISYFVLWIVVYLNVLGIKLLYAKSSIERFIKLAVSSISMKQETITVLKEEYKKLKKKEKIDTELLKDIAMGIKDVLSGKIKEV